MSITNRTEIVEMWKDVVGFEGLYQVSSMGRVKSLSRMQYRGINKVPYFVKERILKPIVTNTGHVHAELGKGHKKLVHRLVLEAFIGSCPQGMQCCHNNGIPQDNRLENLRWDTCKSNAADRFTHGTAFLGPRGETHPFAKLTSKVVKKIRDDYSLGNCTLKELGRKYGIHIMTVSDVVRRKTWKSVP